MPGSARLYLAAALTALPGASAVAQPTVLDEGQFVISREGRRVGTEDFRVRRLASENGFQIEIVATHRVGSREVGLKMLTDTLGSPIQLEYVVRDSGHKTLEVQGIRRQGNRLVLKSDNRAGDAATREVLLGSGTMMIQEDLFITMYFLGRQRPASSSGLGIESWRSRPLAFTAQGPDSVPGTQEAATRYTVGATDAERRDVWIGRDGQILQIRAPQGGLVAVRDFPPR